MTSTIERRVPSSVGNPVDVDRITAAILSAADGATLGNTGTPYGGDGIIVAMPEYGYVLTPDQPESVRRWVERVAPTVSARADLFFGAWYSDGLLYLDVSQVYSSADRDLAITAGRRRNQIAVWDAGRGVEIPTGGTGEVEHAA